MPDPAAILVAARNEADSIGDTVAGLRRAFAGAEVIVADDGSRDATAAVARAAGARVVLLPARGKGQALTLAEREAPAGTLLLCDADLRGDLTPLAASDADVAVAAFAQRVGGGFGLVKRSARLLVRTRTGARLREPLSGQRMLSPPAREACFPLAAGFGAETAMSIDALRVGLAYEEVTLDAHHRATGRDLRGFVHRGRQLADIALTVFPQGRNHRGLRLPLVGALVGLATVAARRRDAGAIAAIALIGLADDLWSGPARGFRAHLAAGRTTGVLKLVGIPLVAVASTRSLSGGLLVSLSANAVNLVDTRPGRGLKAFLCAAAALRGEAAGDAAIAVLLLPYDLREMWMLGDSGSNALGAVLGFRSVRRFGARGRWSAIGALAALTLLGEKRSLGALIERAPLLRGLDRLGRQP